MIKSVLNAPPLLLVNLLNGLGYIIVLPANIFVSALGLIEMFTLNHMIC